MALVCIHGGECDGCMYCYDKKEEREYDYDEDEE